MITPIYKIFYRYNGEVRFVYVKDESFNKTGSIKYRPAKSMIDSAYRLKQIDKNTTLLEVTSGNMGIAISEVAKEYGNKVIIYMPHNMSEERKKIIHDLGAKLVLTKNFDEAFKLAEQNHDGYYLKQFENPFNPLSYEGFCEEIDNKLSSFSSFVAGVGTGGTLIGVANYYKKNQKNISIIAVEPKESLILSTGINHGEHDIQGLSDGFIPKIYQKDLVNQIISVSSDDSILMAKKINEQLHLHVGISSGANLLAAILYNKNNTLTVFPDSDDRYYSTKLFQKMSSNKLIDSIELLKIEIL